MTGTFDQYQDKALETVVFPGIYTQQGLMYAALGLAGEAGEVANKVKKLYRDHDLSDTRNIDAYHKAQATILPELGDVLWYVAVLTAQLLDEGRDYARLNDVANANLAKLAARAATGTLKGSGDHR